MNTTSIIIILVITILVIYLIVKILRRNKYTGGIEMASKLQVIDSSSLATYSYGATNEYTYSIWIYVNDWNVSYGEKKVIFERGEGGTGATGTSSPIFTLYLDEYANNIIAETSVIKNNLKYDYHDNTGLTGSIATSIHAYGTTYQIRNTCDLACNNYGSSESDDCSGYAYTNNLCSLYKGSVNTIESSSSSSFSALKQQNYHRCIVPSVETQRWVNVVVSSNNASVDMYIDGKLVKTCATNGALVTQSGNIYLSPRNKGFDGFTSRFEFKPYYITPKEVWKIYKNGYTGLGGDMNFNYSLKFGIYKGDIEKTSVTI